jgi:dihydrolipoamide dehydrogenase
VEVIHGQAVFAGSRQLRISDAGAGTLAFEHAIIATGSHPMEVPGLESGGERVMTARQALMLRDIPERLLAGGSGYIGLKLGSVYARLGSQVTMVELTGQLLPGIDRDLVQIVQHSLNKRGLGVHLRTKVTGLQTSGAHVSVSLARDNGET